MICDECNEEMQEALAPVYADALFKRGIVVRLHGIHTVKCRCGESPVYPFIGRLAERVRAHPDRRDFYWNAAQLDWTIGVNDHLGAGPR